MKMKWFPAVCLAVMFAAAGRVCAAQSAQACVAPRAAIRTSQTSPSDVCAAHTTAQTARRVTVTGVVVDANGDAIPGVQVFLLPASGAPLAARAGARGRFMFRSVAPGAYTVAAKSAGFSPYSSAYTAGLAAAPLKIVMSLARVKQTVTVTAGANQVTPDTASNTNGVTETAQQLKNLPIFDEDIISTLSRFLDSDAEGTGGAVMLVNGVPAENVDLTPSSIKSIKIDNDPFDAEYARPGWGRMSITTKSGTQKYHGEINFIFRDAVFNARNAFSAVRPPEQRRKFEGMFSGPVGHSRKTSFLISADHDVEDLQSAVFALTGQGTVAENVPSPTHNTQLYGRIDHTINDKNSFAVSAVYHEDSAANQGVGGLVLPEAGTNETYRAEKVRFDQTTVFTPNLLNEFHLMAGQFTDSTTSLSSAPQIDVLGAFTSGGAQADELETKHHFGLMDVATWSHGKHVLKWGMDIPDWARRGLDNQQNFGGTYTFSSLAAYEAGQPLTYSLQQGESRLSYWQKMLGFFAQDDYRWKPNLMFSAGVRWEWENYFSDPDEFEPRFGFAWSPRKSPKTVIRGGAGIFADRVPHTAISNLLYYNGVRLQNYLVTDPLYPNPGVVSGAVPPNITELDPDFRMPYEFIDGIEIERQVGRGATLSATWMDGRDVDAFRSLDLNAPLPPLYAARPDPAIGLLQQYQSAGRGQYDALHLQFRGRLNRYFSGIVRNRYGWSYNNTSSINSYPANQYDLTGEWGRSPWDRRDRFEMLGMFNQGKLLNLGLSVSLYTGGPYDITLGTDPYNDGLLNARPEGVGRNTGQGPGYASVDMRWQHDFRLRPSKRDRSPVFTVAVGAFNVFNTVNYGSIIGNLSSPLFGRAVTASPGRRMQFSTRFQF